MDIGVFSYNDDFVMHPVPFAKALEERGFESVWYGEHTHIPASRATPYPLGGELPKEYIHMMDPLVSLGAVAAATEKLKLGTGVCLVIERDVITLAKEIATLDILSGGRVLFGIGGGWNREEMENHGIPFDRRFRVLREKVEALKALWTQDEASYEGKYVSFDRVWSYPKPLQAPHPPVLAGFYSEHGRKRVARYCDGWMPLDAVIDDIPSAVADVQRLMEEQGRDPSTLDLSIWTTPGIDPDESKFAELQEAGVQRVVVFAPVANSDVVLPFLDRYAKIVSKFA
jgi:probable F420-dependent oxidoreductase